MGFNISKVVESSEKMYICKLFYKYTCKSEEQSYVEEGIVYQHFCSYFYTVAGKKMSILKLSVID